METSNENEVPGVLQSVSRIYPNGRVLDRRLFMKMSALLLSVCPLQSYAHLFSICFSTQYRCKLKNTEGSLRAEERLASDLKSQLREANAAGEATRNVSVEKQRGEPRACRTYCCTCISRAAAQFRAPISFISRLNHGRERRTVSFGACHVLKYVLLRFCVSSTLQLFDQVMDRVRADEGRQLRQGTSTRQGEQAENLRFVGLYILRAISAVCDPLLCDNDNSVTPNRTRFVRACADEGQSIRFAEEARKTRLQLVRARKDLRELWLERDELAMLAGQAIQVRGARHASCHFRLYKSTSIPLATLLREPPTPDLCRSIQMSGEHRSRAVDAICGEREFAE